MNDFYNDDDLDDTYQYLKKCPEWLREYLFHYIVQDVRDDLARLITYVKDLFDSHKSLMMIIEGYQGVGKTLSQYYLSDVLQVGRVIIYSLEDHLKLIENMPERKFVMYPDLTLVFPCRDFMKKESRELQKFTNTLRVFENFYCLALPVVEEGDISFRRHFEVAELKEIHDRRILNFSYGGKDFNIIIPTLAKSIVEEYHQLDKRYKMKAYNKK